MHAHENEEKREDSGCVGVLGSGSCAVLTVRLGSIIAVVGGVFEVTVPLNSVNDEEDNRSQGEESEYGRETQRCGMEVVAHFKLKFF